MLVQSGEGMRELPDRVTGPNWTADSAVAFFYSKRRYRNLNQAMNVTVQKTRIIVNTSITLFKNNMRSVDKDE